MSIAGLEARLLALGDRRSPYIQMRVFHPAGVADCRLPNIDLNTRRWAIGAAFVEMLRLYRLEQATKDTSLQLMDVLFNLKRDQHGRGFFPSETSDLALVCPTMDRSSLLGALCDVNRQREAQGDPQWSYVFDQNLTKPDFLDAWIAILSAHKDCSEVVEFKGLW